MKNLIRKKWILLLCIFMIIAVVTLILCAIYIRENRDQNASGEDDSKYSESNLEDDNIDETNNEESFSIEQARICWNKIESNLFGRWEYIGGELQQTPYIILEGNGSFTTNAWGGNGTTVTGQWEFHDGYIIFDFSDNNYWEETTEEEMNLYSSSGIKFDAETNELTVPVHYTERAEDFTGECSLDHFYIDMMNYFLHRKT